MKGSKKITAVILAVVITVSVLCVIPSLAVETMTFQPTVKGDYIFGIPEKTNFNALLEALPPRTILDVYNRQGNRVQPGSNTYIGSGFTISLNGNSFVAVVAGDVNGDGILDSKDYLQIKRHYLGTYEITGGANLIAAMGEEQSRIKAVRYLMVKRHALGSYNMNIDYIVPYVEPSDDESGWTESWV